MHSHLHGPAGGERQIDAVVVNLQLGNSEASDGNARADVCGAELFFLLVGVHTS